jgi:MSHA biogenesis protein MshQ
MVATLVLLPTPSVSAVSPPPISTSPRFTAAPAALPSPTPANAAGVTTQNYHGAYGLSKDTTISNAGAAANFANNLLAAANFVNGVRVQGTVTYTFPVTAPPKETAPATLTLRAIDTDSVSSAGHTEEQTEIRSGRVHVYNAYGSELVALPVPMRVEYYSATDGWITNTADTCTSVAATSLSLANNVAPTPVSPPTAKTIGTRTTSATVANPFPFLSGDAGLSLSAPGQGGDGYVNITADLSAKTWLRFDWNGAGEVDPTGRATFGLYRGSPRHIYLRERY